MIGNYVHSLIMIVNYSHKTFIVQATGFFKFSINIEGATGKVK